MPDATRTPRRTPTPSATANAQWNAPSQSCRPTPNRTTRCATQQTTNGTHQETEQDTDLHAGQTIAQTKGLTIPHQAKDSNKHHMTPVQGTRATQQQIQQTLSYYFNDCLGVSATASAAATTITATTPVRTETTAIMATARARAPFNGKTSTKTTKQLQPWRHRGNNHAQQPFSVR